MQTCSHCGGAIAEPGEVTGYAGKWCVCWTEALLKESTPNKYKVPQEEIDKYMEQHFKNNVQKPSFSHIINLCEQLTVSELNALISILQQLGARNELPTNK